MTTITLQLPISIMERAVQFARTHQIPIEAFLEVVIVDSIEELQDIADAKEQSRQYEAGEIDGIAWEQFRLELLDMAE